MSTLAVCKIHDMKWLFTTSLLFLLLEIIPAQPTPSNIQAREKAYEQRLQLETESPFANIPVRNIGPSVFSGRVVDIEVDPNDATHFYVAYASGGLWETKNNGTTFEPLFDKEAVMTIGDIAVNWKENIIWVGTGENNSSRSSYAGMGMYRSDDGGKSWSHAGLINSHHIGRIVLHPEKAETLWVAVLGALYSASEDRGIYVTHNGGDTWDKTLYINENCGGVDLVLDPNDHLLLYAAMWERTRRAWDFTEAGEGSGIFRSADGGTSWSKISNTEQEFPDGKGVGRIGLDIVSSEGETHMVAILDNYNRRPDEEVEDEGLTREQLRAMSGAEFLELEKDMIKDFLSENRFPRQYGVDTILQMIKNDVITPLALVEYLEDENSLLFDTEVVGAEVYKWDASDETWERTHDEYLDGLYYSYGYYFGQIRVNPSDPDRLYIMGVPILRSNDGGMTWTNINGSNVHVDHHALWINPDNSQHLILGNDGGINISYDDGNSWIKCNMPPVGQFYAVAVDHAKPYNVYGGTQDNGVWVGPSTYEPSSRWHNTGQYPYRGLLGGDGMQIQVDWRDNRTVYTGLQFGNYYRIDRISGDRKSVKPRHDLGERPLRFNWETPILLSRHLQDIIYLGSNKLHRSLNKGDDWTTISKDLTGGGKKGDVSFGTLSCIEESPLQFGLVYTGSDDGKLHKTSDGGRTWTSIDGGLPKDLWVADIQASSSDVNVLYVALNGYRWDHFDAYLYKSRDGGNSWERIALDLPLEPINTIAEHPNNPDLLFVGTDHGLYVSTDRGGKFVAMHHRIPAVPIHDLVIHEEANDLVVGTHGRSIFIFNIDELSLIDADNQTDTLIVFSPEDIRRSSRWGTDVRYQADSFRTPSLLLPYYTGDGGTSEIQVLKDEQTLKLWQQEDDPGLHYIDYDVTVDPAYKEAFESLMKEDDEGYENEETDNGAIYLPPGKYTLKVEHRGVVKTSSFKVR